jgi:hypothetical protein
MASSWIKFTAIFVLAAALLLTGFFLAWYPSYKSETLKLNLSQSGLTQAERDSLESSLSWWNTAGSYTYGSIANLVILGGLAVLVLAIVYSLTSVYLARSAKAKIALDERQSAPQVEPERPEPISNQYEQNRKKVKRSRAWLKITAVVLLAVILSLAIWMLFFQGHSVTPFPKLEVTNLKIDTSPDWSRCDVTFSVYNRYNSPIIAIGQIVNGINYGYAELAVPAGQTVDESLAIPQLKITNSSSYHLIITFTFDDGYYEDYSKTVYPPQYTEAFSIIKQSLTLNEYNSTEYSIDIKNTGDIPLINANVTISNESNIVIYQSDLMSLGKLMSNETKTLTRTINYTIFQKSSTFHTAVQVKFADESIQSTQTSALPVPTPTPTPSPSPTPTLTSALSPEPTPILDLVLDYNVGSALHVGVSFTF